MAELTSTDKKKIKAEARKAIDNAWKEETERALKGLQTRDWADVEYEQLKKGKKISGYEGHHMKSTMAYPEQAGNPDNIQFLKQSRKSGEVKDGDHYKAHGNNWEPTNGYYDEKAGKTIPFEKGEVPDINKFAKSNPSSQNTEEGAFFMSENEEKGGSKMGEGMGGIGAGMEALGEAVMLMETMGINCGPLVEGLQSVQMATQAMSIAQAALNAVMALNPIALIAIAIAGLVAGIIYLWNTSEDFRNVLTAAWEAISAVFSAVWDGIVLFFTETLPKVIQDVITWFAEFPGKIGEFLTQLVTFFAELPGKINEWLAQMIVKLVTWVSDMAAKAQEVLPGMIAKVVTFFRELPGKLWAHLSSAVAKIGEWASSLISKVKEALPGVISSIMTFFSELPGKILEVGGNLIKGLWNGINNAVGWLGGDIRSIFGSLGSLKSYAMRLNQTYCTGLGGSLQKE